MSERLAVPSNQVITPVAVLVTVVALVAALALGVGVHAWTEEPSGVSASSASVVVSTHPPATPRDEAGLRTTTAARPATADVLPERRIGRPW
ncbi:MAG TPA: hypothetical protein VGN59_17710 [Acidimicrobiia bacterium]|jgi:hypothetical protein